jgi:hypothetical protein
MVCRLSFDVAVIAIAIAGLVGACQRSEGRYLDRPVHPSELTGEWVMTACWTKQRYA